MRHVACRFEQLRLSAEGEPVRISVCHCLACQRRAGSAFGFQARFPAERVRIQGGTPDVGLTSVPLAFDSAQAAMIAFVVV